MGNGRLGRFLCGICIAFCLTGCAARPIHPGSVDKTDSAAFDVLLVYHDGIESAKADLAAGTLPDTVKPVLNKAIDGYNVLRQATDAYHSAALAGQQTPDLLQKLLDAESAAAAGYAELVKIYPKAGTKK